MPLLPFQGTAMALSSDGLSAASQTLGVHAPEIWTVLAVETSGCGYLPDLRPQILYERHIFHRLTQGQYDDGNISDSSPGGYGPSGAHQYDRLALAVAKDRTSALQSCSWGIGQIMGENYALAGFADVEEMVSAMEASEDQQLSAMANFLVNSRLNIPLQAHDWASFARGYNGPNYAINRYDTRLNGEFQKCFASGIPDLNVRAAQLYLTYLGFHPGPVDGVAGTITMSALSDFQTQQGLVKTGTIDSIMLARLSTAVAASNTLVRPASAS
jgi:N-acetylmuramidase/Putative peptidoglycan binding domain